jgi:hypothetical protein
MLGQIAGLFLPLSGICTSVIVWAWQIGQTSPVSLSAVVTGAGIIFAAGGLVVKLDTISKNMATKKDLVDLQLQLTQIYQTKAACEKVHAAKSGR